MIRLSIDKRFPGGRESSSFELHIELEAGGGVTVLFGPSGSGKTLTLDSIAGFVRPDAGRIELDDRVLFDSSADVHLPPRQRHCGYVLQNYALFPHMTLRGNLEFAAARLPAADRTRRIGEQLERFRLTDVAGRRPHEVSGGQKQRCSIARALIGEPRILLLDEPARGLDAPLRADLYAVLRQVREEFGTPILLVTHDLDECFELGDRVLILVDGKVAQQGAPRGVLEAPASIDVARLLGRYCLVDARLVSVSAQETRIVLGGGEFTGPPVEGARAGDEVALALLPDRLRARPGNGRKVRDAVPAVLERVVDGPHRARLEFAGGLTVEQSYEEHALERENRTRDWSIEFPPGSIRIFRSGETP